MYILLATTEGTEFQRKITELNIWKNVLPKIYIQNVQYI